MKERCRPSPSPGGEQTWNAAFRGVPQAFVSETARHHISRSVTDPPPLGSRLTQSDSHVLLPPALSSALKDTQRLDWRRLRPGCLCSPTSDGQWFMCSWVRVWMVLWYNASFTGKGHCGTAACVPTGHGGRAAGPGGGPAVAGGAPGRRRHRHGS